MSAVLRETPADKSVRACLDQRRSFSVVAGAGSGKTTSLLTALDYVRSHFGARMRRNSQRVVCVTYTNRAVDVISRRLRWDDLFLVTTLHGFLWSEIKRYPADVRNVLRDVVLPGMIEKKRAEDNGGASQKATAARQRVGALENDLVALEVVSSFSYGDSSFSNYASGELGHDDVLTVASILLDTSSQLRRVVGQKYPYIFVDEAQDTHEGIVSALNKLCATPGELPLVGYFGDPMQQIYDNRAGSFAGPEGAEVITKTENFRCAPAVIRLLNAFRSDVEQVAAGRNAEVDGSVLIRLVESETPALARGRYSPDQLERASASLDAALDDWEWAGRADVKHLYLVRQMIARRMGFSNLHGLFVGEFASSRAKDDYERGQHVLLRPFLACLYPLIQASSAGDHRRAIDVLRQNAPEFDPKGRNAKRTLAHMASRATALVTEVGELWRSSTVGEVLRFGRDNGLFQVPRKLDEHLARGPRIEEFDETVHGLEKADWLADQLFVMGLSEVERFCQFMAENTIFSTQHGVKGEEYPNVLVVFDDVGSAWNNYNFAKTLVPTTAGIPTDRQRRLSENLAYVCFSRAEVNLRIVMFIANAAAARRELIDRGLFLDDQIEIQT